MRASDKGAVVSNRARILALIQRCPGLTDRQIREATGIEPHQQVNGICRRLEQQGLIRRERGPRGITNHLVEHTAPAQNSQPARGVASHRLRAAPTAQWRIGPLDWPRTLLVLPCSAAKTDAASVNVGRSLLEHLPRQLADELAAARRDNLADADLEDAGSVAALDRYDGALYRQLGSWKDTLRQRHVLVISGGYGLVTATEAIGRYDARFRNSAWSNDLISRCLSAYATGHGLTTVVGFAAASGDYAKPVHTASWPPGIAVWLVTPHVTGGGAMRRTPTAIGQAVVALIENGTLDSAWRAGDNTRLHATAVQ